jgi:DNA-binding NarL/FixJ family response regulator
MNKEWTGHMTDANCIRVLSIDDQPVVREGIGSIINNAPDMLLAGTASNGREGIEAFRALKPDVTLIDLPLPDLSGLDVTKAIRSEFPEARIIVFTAFSGDVDVQRSLKAGARGYLLKNTRAPQMLDAIRQVHAGKRCVPPEIAAGLAEFLGDGALSEREVEVLQQVASGNRNREIGSKLFIAEETVKAHIKHIMDKLGAKDRTESVMIAVRRGFIHL